MGQVTHDFRIVSGQPKIIENEKGLLIDFKIIGTQIGDEEVNPSLTVSFGNIDAGASESARWLMTSTLQGHFIEYNASFEHVDDFGNTRTSLIDEVNFHELVHALKVDLPGKDLPDDHQFDFLANDIADPAGLPDMLYLSGGGEYLVSTVTNAVTDGPVSVSDLQVQVTATVLDPGWTYFVLPDPGAAFRLKEVIRSDGVNLRVGDHAWRTDRIFGAEGRATYVNRLHILDLNSTGSYTLVYGKPDETPPTIEQVGPVTPDPRNDAVSQIDVVFSEALADGIDGFDVGDLRLVCGTTQISLEDAVSVVKIDDTHYSVQGLAVLTGTAGDYTLAINAAGIQDRWANAGSGTAGESWTTAPNVPVINSLGAGLRSVTNTPVSQVEVVFSKDIDPATLTLEEHRADSQWSARCSRRSGDDHPDLGERVPHRRAGGTDRPGRAVRTERQCGRRDRHLRQEWSGHGPGRLDHGHHGADDHLLGGIGH